MTYPGVYSSPSRAYERMAPQALLQPVLSSPVSLPLPHSQPYYPAVQSMVADTYNAISMNRYRAERHKEKGNEYRSVQLPYMAIVEYEQAIVEDSQYTDAYYNLGRTHIVVGQPLQAVQAFENLLRITPDDHEARISLAEQLAKLGRRDEARAHYEYILGQEPGYDSAARNLAYLKVIAEPRTSPFMTQFKVLGRGYERVNQAKTLLKTYYLQRGAHKEASIMDQIQYDFSPTQRVNGVANLAEYDHQKRTIRFSPELAFSDSRVLATYLSHELVHALDGDGVSSILEEEDAYREQSFVWRELKGNIKEPNLDLALRYYDQSPDRLNQAVREIYQMRDPLISEKSPGHGFIYPVLPALQQMYIRSEMLEKNFKYTDWIYRQIKSLLTGSGIS